MNHTNSKNKITANEKSQNNSFKKSLLDDAKSSAQIDQNKFGFKQIVSKTKQKKDSCEVLYLENVNLKNTIFRMTEELFNSNYPNCYKEQTEKEKIMGIRKFCDEKVNAMEIVKKDCVVKMAKFYDVDESQVKFSNGRGMYSDEKIIWNGLKYSQYGFLVKGIPQGYCKLKNYSYEELYEGYLENGKRNDTKAIYIFKDEKYVGGFYMDQKCGHGEKFYSLNSDDIR